MAWRIEEACLNARPSTREILLGRQWLLRLEGGETRRTNAVSPLRATSYNPEPILDAAQRIYRAYGQPLVFRVPAIADGLDERLEAAGWSKTCPVSTFYRRLDEPPVPDPQVEITAAPTEAWFAAKFRLTPKVGATPQLYRGMAAAILLPKAFAALSHEGQIAAVAYGAIRDGILVIESVVTDPAMRGRGLARRLVGTLLTWGRQEGAGLACLQVEAENVPALALYRSLGFRDEIYRYHYRSQA